MLKSLVTLTFISSLVLGGCSFYKMDIQQGNYITQAELDQVKAGMSPAQVQDILGTPLLVDDFHTDRWDYVFYLKSPRKGNQRSSITVFFNNGVVSQVRQDTPLVETKLKAVES